MHCGMAAPLMTREEPGRGGYCAWGDWMYNWAVFAENHLHHQMIYLSPTPTTPKVAAPDLRHACQPIPSQLDPRTQ